jgi:hypothetical protein
MDTRGEVFFFFFFVSVPNSVFGRVCVRVDIDAFALQKSKKKEASAIFVLQLLSKWCVADLRILDFRCLFLAGADPVALLMLKIAPCAHTVLI